MNSFQNHEVNKVPQSETMDVGTPYFKKNFRSDNRAKSGAPISSLAAATPQILHEQSRRTKIALFPCLSFGSPVMRSHKTMVKGTLGIGIVHKSPRLSCSGLFC